MKGNSRGGAGPEQSDWRETTGMGEHQLKQLLRNGGKGSRLRASAGACCSKPPSKKGAMQEWRAGPRATSRCRRQACAPENTALYGEKQAASGRGVAGRWARDRPALSEE